MIEMEANKTEATIISTMIIEKIIDSIAIELLRSLAFRDLEIV
jgi:hypothetical protein